MNSRKRKHCDGGNKQEKCQYIWFLGALDICPSRCNARVLLLVLIYSKNLEDHVQHVREVLCILLREKLFANLPKCTFAQNKLGFLGIVVSANGIEVDSSKV
jgi:hypothetical protein